MEMPSVTTMGVSNGLISSRTMDIRITKETADFLRVSSEFSFVFGKAEGAATVVFHRGSKNIVKNPSRPSGPY
jgi:hypothetical protein